jgi:hypothetical protein
MQRCEITDGTRMTTLVRVLAPAGAGEIEGS